MRLACRNADELRIWIERFGSVGVVQGTQSNGFTSYSSWNLVEKDGDRNFDTVEVAQVTNAGASTRKSGVSKIHRFGLFLKTKKKP